LVVLGLGISPYVSLPSLVLAFRLPDTPAIASFTLTPTYQVGLVVVLLAWVILAGLARADWRLRRAGLGGLASFWALPTCLILGAFALFERLDGPLPRMFGMASAAIALGLTVIAQFRTLNATDPWFEVARLGLNAVAYALALGLFVLIDLLPLRPLVAAPLAMLGSVALTLELWRSAPVNSRRLWIIAALVGLMTAGLVWALSRSALRPLAAGFLLLLAFYGMTWPLQQRLWGRFDRRAAIELLAVVAIALALVLRLA